MAEISPIKPDDIANVAKDALYVSVGLAVIAFQRAQVKRRELSQQLNGGLGDVTKRVDDRVKTVEERLGAVEERFEHLAEQLEARLPDQIGDAAKQARLAAKEARSQIRELVRTNGHNGTK
jgi:chaperonin cofactor prefoldin